MKGVVLDQGAAKGLDSERLRALLLVRAASARDGASKAKIAGDVAALLSPRLSAAQGRLAIARELDALAAAGLISLTRGRAVASAAGASQSAVFLGLKDARPGSWRDGELRLLAKALGLEQAPVKKIRALATPAGLRTAVLERAFNLKLKGVVSPSRLRSALAAVALERAFGEQLKAQRASLRLSAKAERLLAGQLAETPRDFASDRRLIAVLAAQVAGAHAGLAELRLMVLRRYLDASETPAPAADRQPPKMGPLRPRLVEPPPAIAPPELSAFVGEVRKYAAMGAQGWAGDRKAYISHVWRQLREGRSEWGLSENEFKGMLAQAHRSGQLRLANADLKDDSNLKDVRESALVFKNTVFHFVRVDD
jgi:hypothetical protein